MPESRIIKTLTREIKEALSADTLPKTVSYYSTFKAQAHGHAEGIIVRMTCYTAGFTGLPTPDSEIEKIVWLTSADSEDISPIDKIIFADLKNGSAAINRPW